LSTAVLRQRSVEACDDKLHTATAEATWGGQDEETGSQGEWFDWWRRRRRRRIHWQQVWLRGGSDVFPIDHSDNLTPRRTRVSRTVPRKL